MQDSDGLLFKDISQIAASGRLEFVDQKASAKGGHSNALVSKQSLEQLNLHALGLGVQQKLTPGSDNIVLQAGYALACRHTIMLTPKLETVARIEVYDLFTGAIVNAVDHQTNSETLRLYGSSRFVVVLEPMLDKDESHGADEQAFSQASTLTIYDTSNEEETTISTATILFPIVKIEFSEDNRVISFGFGDNLYALLILDAGIYFIQAVEEIAFGRQWVFYRQQHSHDSVALNISNSHCKTFRGDYKTVFGDDHVAWINPDTKAVVLLNLNDDSGEGESVATLDHDYSLVGISTDKSLRLSFWLRDDTSNIYFLDADSHSIVKVLRSHALKLRAVDQTILFFDEAAAFVLIRLQRTDKFKRVERRSAGVPISCVNFHLSNIEEQDLVVYNDRLTKRYILNAQSHSIFMQKAGDTPAPYIQQLDLTSTPLDKVVVNAFLPISDGKFILATSSISGEERSKVGRRLYTNCLHFVSIRTKAIDEYSFVDLRQITQLRSYENRRVIVASLTSPNSTQRHSLFLFHKFSKLKCIELVEGRVLDANTSLAVLSKPAKQHRRGDGGQRSHKSLLVIFDLQAKIALTVKNPSLRFIALDGSSVYFASAQHFVFRYNYPSQTTEQVGWVPSFPFLPFVSIVVSKGRYLLSLSESLTLTVSSTETGKLLHALPFPISDALLDDSDVARGKYQSLEQMYMDIIRLSPDGRRLLIRLPGQDRLIIISDNDFEQTLKPAQKLAAIAKHGSRMRKADMATGKKPIYFNGQGLPTDPKGDPDFEDDSS